MAKVNAQHLVAQLGLRPQLLRTAASADLLSPIRDLSEHEEALLTAHVAKLYQRFLAVAAEGRGRTLEHIDSIARGRVWTGGAAREHGLVDAIGGMEQALSEARALVPQLTEAERSRLRPRVYRLKSKRGFGLRALLLGPWLRALEQLAARFELQREAALYLAPLDAPE
jgi:ClpP class serine protease